MDQARDYTEGLNPEEIMKKIKEKVAIRKANGAYTKDDEELIRSSFSLPVNSAPVPQRKVDLSPLNNSWNIDHDYQISSHRKIIGPVLTGGRKLVNVEVKRYVDPIVIKQKEFNMNIIRAIQDAGQENQQYVEALQNEIATLKDKIQDSSDRTEALQKSVSSTSYDIKAIKDHIARIDDSVNIEINKKMDGLISSLDNEIRNKASLIKVLDNKVKNTGNTSVDNGDHLEYLNYYLFEENFRGPTHEIKERQSLFLKYFKNGNNVLDIGCGRGEFLELARENKITAAGIDTDDNMVEYCVSRGLNVKKVDAITYLETLEDKSLDGIFIDQVVEHLEPNYLIKMLALCNKKLKQGYYIIAETVNPLSLTSLINFYMDMTHKKPIHPSTLRYLFESTDFQEVNVTFLAPLPDEALLKKINANGQSDEKDLNAIEAYNQNIDKLNHLLYGPQDYFVAAKK